MVHGSKANRVIRSLLNDPYLTVRNTYEKYNHQVPPIRNRPDLSCYGLPNNIYDIIQEIDSKNNDKVSKIKISLWLTSIILVFIFCWYIYGIEAGYGSLFVTTWLFGLIIYEFINIKIPETDIHTKYYEYLNHKECYEFWERLNTIDFWMKLDGHEFEYAVASYFNSKGYETIVSKSGGDNGIDIILKNSEESIVVQCKAHKKPIGPAVARDFFGTMVHFGYKKGIIVSRSGFTNGVEEFIKNKPIKLLSLNGILSDMHNLEK